MNKRYTVHILYFGIMFLNIVCMWLNKKGRKGRKGERMRGRQREKERGAERRKRRGKERGK